MPELKNIDEDGYRFYNLKWPTEYLKIRYEKHKLNWDTVGLIVGDEGVSKSNCGLHFLDIWSRITKGKCIPEDVRHVCMTGKDFVDDLGDDIKDDMTIFDEAGELDSRRAMSNFNVMLSQAYKVIRADRLFTILILPDLWDLEPRFRNRRVKFLIYVYRRGKAKMWLRDGLRKIIALNEGRIIKDIERANVKPDLVFDFPEYKGAMAEEYAKMKEKKTKEAREKLKEMVNGKPQKIPKTLIQRIKIEAYNDAGLNGREIAKKLNVTPARVSQILSGTD